MKNITNSNTEIKKSNKSIGYDVIENHKHIDISSEAMLIIFASNIYRKGFQSDVVSEIEKCENTPRLV